MGNQLRTVHVNNPLMLLKEVYSMFHLKADYLKKFHWQRVAFVPILRMVRCLHLTGYFVNSEPGNITKAEWPMIFGYMTLRPNRLPILQTIPARILSRCGRGMRSSFFPTGIAP